jgi:hypothetical protein
MMSGLRYGAAASSFESSISTLWAKSAVQLNYGTIRFYADAADTVAYGTAYTPTEVFRVNHHGTVTLKGGFAAATGVGITFPATQVASTDANTLDDYREGTFTPTIVGMTVAGAGTYTSQVGRYTRVGNRVFYQVYLVWTAHTGTGNLQINGLPFTPSGSASSAAQSVLSHNVAMTAGCIMQCFIVGGTASISLRQSPTGGGAVNLIPMDTSGELMVSGHYEV